MTLSPAAAIIFFFFFILAGPTPSLARSHVISFRSPNLYPEGLAWDPLADHFLVGSLRSRTILSVSDAGVAETFVSDASLPPNSTILGLAVDTVRHRLLAVVNSIDPLLPPFNALAAYDLRSRQRLFLSRLPSAAGSGGRDGANDVAVDFNGNAYVTNSLRDFIWKVNADGEASIFSRSPIFTATPVDPTAPYSSIGLNGIAYVSKGYLLVVQSNTGKMYKVDADDGTARQVLLSRDLTLADGIAVRKDGVVLVVSNHRLLFLKSQDSWGEAVVYDKTALQVEGFATTVVAGKEDRAYVLYGHLEEGIKGNVHREVFRIAEVVSERESGDDKVWIYVLLGLGLTYFMIWRFQMKNLVKHMNKKIN